MDLKKEGLNLTPTITSLFEKIVASHENKIAVGTFSESLTYQALNKEANELANYLRQSGVQSGTRIAVYLDASLDYIITVLAIIKAGCAYIPLDIETPINRIVTIWQESNFDKIIIHSMSLTRFNAHNGLTPKIIEIDTFRKLAILKDNSNPPTNYDCNAVACIMYTSGSTGMPKGCMIAHRGIVRLVNKTNYITITPNDHIAQIASVAFDASTFEIWGALLNGALLYIIPKKTLLSFNDFSHILKENKISIILVTTALLHLMIKAQPDCFDQVKYLLFGGENANHYLLSELVKRRQEKGLKQLKLINLYGPTECSVVATFFEIASVNAIKNEVPIGQPISHTTVYILDENLKPVPPETPGELYLGGEGLALGYLNNPTETTAKFIKSPWNHNEKLYKTGDLVYATHQGLLIFIGRVDQQIKIRGFRIEIAEIEAWMVKHPFVKQAVVTVEKAEQIGKYLVGYVSFHNHDKKHFASFRQFLKENLQSYMIPSKLIVLDTIPFTHNGKVDRAKLSQLNSQKMVLDDEKPSNHLEESITHILASFLETPAISISVTENFFDLGMNSLMLTQACALIQPICQGKRISIIDLYAYPTIRSLTNYILSSQSIQANHLKSEFHRAYSQKRLKARKQGSLA